MVVNDNKNAAYKAVKHLIDTGYRKIAFLGGSDKLSIYKDRKEGYIKAIKESDLNIPYNYIVNNALTVERGMQVASELLDSNDPPDAFFTISDYSAFGILKVAASRKIRVPDQIGIVGFSNETFTEMISPALSSVDQKSRKLGKDAANIYFDSISKEIPPGKFQKKVIGSSTIIRSSSLKKTSGK
jgi:LacI family transcriptional regulator